MKKKCESTTNEQLHPDKALYTQLANQVQESCYHKFIKPFFDLNETKSEHSSNQTKSSNNQKAQNVDSKSETSDRNELKEKAPSTSQRVILRLFYQIKLYLLY